VPVTYDASKEWANKKVVLFAVPGAFTPGCHARHMPGFTENLEKIKAKGVDYVAVIAFNDAFVMSAWSKSQGVKNDDIVRISIPEQHPISLCALRRVKVRLERDVEGRRNPFC